MWAIYNRLTVISLQEVPQTASMLKRTQHGYTWQWHSHTPEDSRCTLHLTYIPFNQTLTTFAVWYRLYWGGLSFANISARKTKSNPEDSSPASVQARKLNLQVHDLSCVQPLPHLRLWRHEWAGVLKAILCWKKIKSITSGPIWEGGAMWRLLKFQSTRWYETVGTKSLLLEVWP
jgi:hypothetical protein